MLHQILIAGAALILEPTVADQAATAEEVVARVRQAAALIQESPDAALPAIADASAPFTWKDTYVFVVDCGADLVVVNPRFPERVGGDIKQHSDYAGYQYGLALCETAKQPDGGWVDYCWPRPGTDRPRMKSSFVLSVPGTPYQVGAGIYRSKECHDATGSAPSHNNNEEK